MSIDQQKSQKVVDALTDTPSATAFTTEVTMKRVGGPDISAPLEDLERNADIARARVCYASQQEIYWRNELHKRSQDFNEAVIAYYAKKYDLNDEDLSEAWGQNYIGVYENKFEKFKRKQEQK